MQPTKTTIRRLACTAALALTAHAGFATGAAAGAGAKGSEALDCKSARAQACTTDAESRALVIRSAALNRTKAEEFIPGVTDFPSRLGEAGESSGAVSKEQFVPGVTDFPSALGQSGERAAEARLSQHSPQGLPVYVQTAETGFDWSAAAAGAIAATLLLLTAALAVRMARRIRVAVG